LKQLQEPFRLFFSQATAADHGVNVYLERADMNGRGFCVHDCIVAGGNTRDPVHGMPLAACWRWIKNIGAVAH